MHAQTALMVAGVIFAIVAVIHLLRLFYKFEIIIAGKVIPMWASTVGLIVSGILSLWMFLAI